MLYRITLIAFLALAGCATSENYEKVLETWIGSKESELVSQWGVPDGFYESENIRYLTYNTSSSGYVPGTPATVRTTIIGNTAYTTQYGGSSGYAYSLNCKTTFSIRNGTIFLWSFEGNDCIADDPDD